jgi:hypothetical protein
MTQQQHPITPPPELVEQWMQVHTTKYDLARQAAQWGADQQLAEDAKWLDHNALNEPYLRITPVGESLKEAMRPKPPSLKEQAKQALFRFDANAHTTADDMQDDFDLIRRALEQLPDNE